MSQQVYGALRVTLTRGTNQPVSGAIVLVTSLEQGNLLRFSTRTDDAGQSTINNVPSGTYKVSMRKDGCKTHEEPFVPISADSTSEISVTLIPGDPGEREVGDGSAVSILKLDRADVSTSFSLHQIQSLPLYQQNLSLYELLVPGALRTHNVLSSQQNPQSGVYASQSGQHFSGTEVIVDGTVDRDPLQGIVVLNPSLDSVSEVKITTQNYGADVGPATGGVVSLQTRSGTNQLHGSAFGYRVSGFGQADVPDFNQTSSLLGSSKKRNDFGASLGGPLIRDRLFLFGDYRGIRQTADGQILTTVPIQAIHDTCTGVSGTCDLSAYEAAYDNANPGKTLFNSPFTGGKIPNSAVSPEMVSLLTPIPLPNYGPSGAVTNNYLASGADSFRDDNFDVRGDYVISGKLRLFTRYSFADFRESGAPAFGAAIGGVGTNPFKFAGVMRDRNQGVSAGFSMDLSPTLLTDFRFGFFRYNLRMDSLDTGSTPATNAHIYQLNFPGDFYTSGMPDIELDNPNAAGLPIAGTLDFMRLGYSPQANVCNCPLREREQEFQFVDNWTKLLGKHNIRWGVDLRYLQNYRLSSDSRPAGHLEFQNSPSSGTGFSLGDFMIGMVAFFDRSYRNTDNPAALNAGERQNRLFFYGEDTWRVNSRLTLNYGLRWELYLPQSVTGANAGGWLQLGSGATPGQDKILVAGEDGVNLQGGVQASLKNFGPRVGLAYLVNPRTVIRAGYGRVFDPGYAGTIFGIAATQSPPVSVLATVANGLTINSNANPGTAAPIDVCIQFRSGSCTVPKYVFPAPPFTISDLYQQNILSSPNPKASGVQSGSIYVLPRHMRLPTVDSWNVAVQEQLDRHSYLEISYVANKGTHVLNDSTGGGAQVPYYNLNQPTLAGFIGTPQPASGSQPAAANCRQGNLIRDFSPPYTTFTPDCKILAAYRTPYVPWNTPVLFMGADASSNYNSLQVKVRREFNSGFSILANYTWSKVMDFDNLYYAIDPSFSRGAGNFDRKHSLVMTNIWDLPFGRRGKFFSDAGPVLNRFVGGWSLAAVTYVASGLPFSPTYLATSCNQDNDSGAFHICRPNLVGTVHTTGTISQWFTTTDGQPLLASCGPPITTTDGPCPAMVKDPNTKKLIQTPTGLQGFDPTTGQPLAGPAIGPWQRPGAGLIGNAGRNSLRGPNFFQVDLAIAKSLAITEHVGLQFRVDAFNILNRLNLANPNPNVDTPAGGTITSLADGAIQRQMQFSLRVSF